MIILKQKKRDTGSLSIKLGGGGCGGDSSVEKENKEMKGFRELRKGGSLTCDICDNGIGCFDKWNS